MVELEIGRRSMSQKITVYQKPTCTKCKSTLRILRERGAEFDTVNYYETPLASNELRDLIKKLGISPRELLRKDEQAYRDLNLARRDVSDDELIELMVANPDLIQR